jgi:hypothetical protein
MPHHRLLRLSVFLVLAGCASLSANSRMDKYDKISLGYERALSWSDFTLAYSATKAAQESQLLPDAGSYADIKVTSYDPAAPQTSQEGMTIKRVARIRYVHTTRMTELNLVTEEEWRYSDEAGRWFLYSGFPKFK